MQLHQGRIADLARNVVDPAFIAASARRFTALFGQEPSAEEVQSWRRSWPALFGALLRAGLGELHVLLEYLLPATGERVDGIVLGESPDGRLAALVIELKQWTSATTIPTMPGMVRAGGRLVQHPARQVGCYTRYLRDWVSSPQLPLHIDGLAMLHDAPSSLVAELRRASAAHPVLGSDDLDLPAAALTQALRCAGFQRASPHRIEALLDAAHRPSPGLLSRAGGIIAGHDALTLLGEQDLARQYVLRAVEAAMPSSSARGTRRKGLVVVTGGAGTGKTVIACRLFGDLCTKPEANPRLLSPSGTITKQLKRLVGDDARGLITTFTEKVPNDIDDTSVVLLDEAHRARTYPSPERHRFPIILRNLINRAGVTVMFLDERQIIRPTEGVTLAELRRFAADNDVAFAHVDLTTQFRCNGSKSYIDWVDGFLEPVGVSAPWTGHDYDLAVSSDPDEFSGWVDEHVENGQVARISAGFCWPWESPSEPPLLHDVRISWAGPDGLRQWTRPWNARAEELDDACTPGRPYWATDAGGQDQVGCIYTAQGMEYAYNVVIIGDDLVRRGDRWVGQPRHSKDRDLPELPPDRYLPYALNTYRVLATRGTKGARLYSTDPETRAYLQALLPPHQSALAAALVRGEREDGDVVGLG